MSTRRSTTPAWLRYERAAKDIIARLQSELGLSEVEGKQVIAGESGTDWEIDAKANVEGSTAFVIIECRRYTTSRLKQEEVAALAWRVQDTGASAALVVSPLGLQEGAKKVASSAGIYSMQMTANSSLQRFVVTFLEGMYVSLTGVQATGSVGTLTPIVENNVSDG